jgi:hypothetical protein
MKYLVLFAIVASLTGCRAVTSKSSVANTFTAGNDIILKQSGTEGLQEGTQAADKEVGDISPSTSATVTPQ